MKTNIPHAPNEHRGGLDAPVLPSSEHRGGREQVLTELQPAVDLMVMRSMFTNVMLQSNHVATQPSLLLPIKIIPVQPVLHNSSPPQPVLHSARSFSAVSLPELEPTLFQESPAEEERWCAKKQSQEQWSSLSCTRAPSLPLPHFRLQLCILALMYFCGCIRESMR